MARWLASVTPGRGIFLDPIRYADGYTRERFTAQSLEQCRRVLIVGDAGGRDSHYLSHLGHDIVQLDLAAQDDVPDLVVQSIEDPTPFADAEFDGVVLNEVIEHLYRDLDALREGRFTEYCGPAASLWSASRPLDGRIDRLGTYVFIRNEPSLAFWALQGLPSPTNTSAELSHGRRRRSSAMLRA